MEKCMFSTNPCAAKQPEQSHSHRDFFIIDAHLKKARESSEAANRLHHSGRHQEAVVQNKLTRVFIHNALARLNRQYEDPRS